MIREVGQCRIASGKTIGHVRLIPLLVLSVLFVSGRIAVMAQSTGTVTVNFSYDGNEQTFTVPVGVSSVRIKVWGGGGGQGGTDCSGTTGQCTPASASFVGYVDATYNVSATNTIRIYTGEKGDPGLNNVGGRGGGAGGFSPYSTNYGGGRGGNTGNEGTSGGGGGGGAATVVTINNALRIVAGGAGGGGGRAKTLPTSGNQNGDNTPLSNNSTVGGQGSDAGTSNDGGGGGGGGGGNFASHGGTIISVGIEVAGRGGKRGANSVSSTGLALTTTNDDISWTGSGKVEITYTANSGTASSNQTICSGVQPANITLSNYAGTIQWQVSSDNTSWSNISGATAATLTSAQMGTLTATRYYRAYVGGVVYSNTITVTVEPPVSWTGSTNSDWNTASNWSPAIVPSLGCAVTLPTGLSRYPALTADATVQTLTVSGGSFALGSSTLSLTGNLTNNGSITGTGRLLMAGTTVQTISGAGTITNLEINKTTGTTADKTVTITAGTGNMQTLTGKLTPTAGVLATNGNLTLRSDIDGTARVGRGSDLGGYISGNVTTQRYLSKTAGGSRNGRAWRLVTIPVLGAGKLSDVFMAGQPGADLTDPDKRNIQPNDLGTVVIGHNQPNATAATAAGFDWIGVQNQVSSLRFYQQNAGAGSFASSQVPDLNTTYTDARQGYMLFARGDRRQTYNGTGNSSATVLQATGALKQGTINVTIPALASAGFVLVGNPYMALLDLEKVFVDNSTVIANTVYVWDANIDGNSFMQGGYRAVIRNGVNDWTATGAGVNPQYIESGSAFFVKPTASGGTLSIKEAHKVDGTPGIAPHATMTDGPSRLFINLEVTDTANRRLVDGAVAFFDTNYKDGLGDAADIAPMTNLTVGSITLRQSGVRLSMEGRPWPADSAARILPVDMRNLGDDAYVLRILPTNMNKEGFTAKLKDRHLNQETSIKLDEEILYSFRRTGDPGIDSSRFEIVYRLSKPTNAGTLTPDDAAGEIGPRLYPNPAKSADVKLSLGSLAPGRYEVQVLDMSGRAFWKKSIEHLSSNTAHQILQGHKLAAGQYLVRISLNDRLLHMLALIHD